MTETPTPSAVARAASAAAAVGLAVAGIGAIGPGAPAAYGALVGTAIAVGVFAFGTSPVEMVARVAPTASLVFAMVTYTFQVVLMALAFVVLNATGALDDQLDATWVGVAIIAGALVWMAVQIRVATTARIPAFQTTEGGAR